MRVNCCILSFLLMTVLFKACENYDDDPIFPASDFIATGNYQGEYFPTNAWRSCAPEEVGMDPVKLKELNEEVRLLLDMNIDFRNLIIIKDGYIVAEQYYSDEYGMEDLHSVYSCTKSLTSACCGIAIDKGYLSGIDEKMVDFFPDSVIQNDRENKLEISLKHLLTMSSGMEWHEIEYSYFDDRNTFRQWMDSGGGVAFVLNQPMVSEPGVEYSYSSGTSHVLSGILQKATGMRTDSFAMKHLFEPLGITDYTWPEDDEGVAYGGSGVRLRSRDMARFGYLYLMNGKWEGDQLIPEDWVLASRQQHIKRKYIPDSYYGYQFWVSDYGTYSAVGWGGQWITMVPEHNLLMVCNNAFTEGDDLQWTTPERLLTTYIIPSIE